MIKTTRSIGLRNAGWSIKSSWGAGYDNRPVSELPSASVSNRVQVRNLSYENEYDLHSNGLVSKTHFHMKGFALGLVLKQRQKRTRKWPIIEGGIRDENILAGCEIYTGSDLI